MIDEIKKQLFDYETVTITKQNFGQIFEIYDTNQDFFLLTNGKNANIESSMNDIDATPPCFEIEQKIYISIWEKSNVIGVLDLLTGYPEQTCIWIGLLLIHGKMHGKKIGGKIVTAILNASKTAGYRGVQLGVIENNVKAMAFWQKHGFVKIGHKENIVVMEKRIA